jgi:hypothetical protein
MMGTTARLARVLETGTGRSPRWVEDAVGSGAVLPSGGDAGALKNPPPLTSGDVVTMTVEGIGTITNTVVKGLGGADCPRPATPAGPPLSDIACFIETRAARRALMELNSECRRVRTRCVAA